MLFLVVLVAQVGDLPQDMSGSGHKTVQQVPAKDAEDDDVLVRSSTWSGETKTKAQVTVETGGLLYSDSKCYGGRFTYGQWRRYFAQERQNGTQQDASGQSIQAGRTRNFSWNAFVQFFRPELWLLVLLHADAAAMRAIASSCRGYTQITLPWRRRGKLGTSSSEAELGKLEHAKLEMPVVQLAARLRCGFPLAEELLSLKPIQLPSRCCSWLDLLYQQEMKGWEGYTVADCHIIPRFRC